MIELDRLQMTIWRMRIACWINKAKAHAHILCNTYYFSNTTVFAHKRLIVTLRFTLLVLFPHSVSKSTSKGGKEAEGVSEYGVEENIWT